MLISSRRTDIISHTLINHFYKLKGKYKMNTLRHFVIKLGMMDKFGYTYVHSIIDFAIFVSLLMLILSFIF